MSTHYTGEVDGQLLRHGKGEYRYPNPVFRFDGSWKTGRKCGQGVFAVAGGSTFEGDFVNGEIEGKGTKTWPDGRRYDGDFSKGEACGNGCFISPSGESYIGTWAENKRHGQGELVLAGGDGTYVGDFRRHRYHGDGRLFLASGYQYVGAFCNGLPHGLGAAVYPGGSTFKGRFAKGKKSGFGGKYVCGVTGICFEGEWTEGKLVSPASILKIELDSTDMNCKTANDGGCHTKTKSGMDKGGKGANARSKAANKQSLGEEFDGVDVEKPVVAQFNARGGVIGLWCRCLRNRQPTKTPELSPEHQENIEASACPAIERPSEIASEESGRTLAVTLHEVAESSSESLGVPVLFFVRRPDATDVSECLNRYPTDGLIALYQRDKRCYPKGALEKLVIASGAGSSNPNEQAAPELSAKGQGANISKHKGSEHPLEDNCAATAVEARWQTVKGEVGSNRCLVIGAGKNFFLATPQLFQQEPRAEKDKRLSTPCEEKVGTAESGLPEQGDEKHEVKQGDLAVAPCPRDDSIERERVIVGCSSPFTLCLDFRLDLDLAALADDDHKRKKRTSVNEGGVTVDDRHAVEKTIKLVSCGKRADVYVVVRPWTPVAQIITNNADHAKVGNSAEDLSMRTALGSRASATPLQTEDKAKCDTLNARASTARVSRRGTVDVSDDPTTTWYIYAILVRLGAYAGSVLCMNPTERNCQQDSVTESALGANPSPATKTICDLAAWHTLALAVNMEEQVPVLCVNGDVWPLRQDISGVPDAICEGSEFMSNGVIVGGAGGEWATLAVKNLAVYNTARDANDLRAITCVFSAWRAEQEAAGAADLQEEMRWLEEAKQAAEDGREPEERPEWQVGAESTMSLRMNTVRGEAQINNVVLPKAALKGGEWLLRVEDVSHKQAGSTGEAASASATDEERGTFPPLPGQFIKLQPNF